MVPYALVSCHAILVTITHASVVEVDWSACSVTRNTAVSMLVAADPEWIPSGILSRTAVDGVKSLSQAGGDNLRLLNFNIFPLMSCAQVAYSRIIHMPRINVSGDSGALACIPNFCKSYLGQTPK